MSLLSRPEGDERRAPRGWVSRVGMLLGLVALVALGAAGMGLWTRRQGTPPSGAPIRFSLAIPSDQEVVFGGSGNPTALSPDGSMVAYVGRTRQGHGVYVRRLDSLKARLLEGTESAVEPFFSPDGEWIAFLGNDYELRKVRARGGAVTLLANVPRYWGGTWGPNGTIVIGTRAGGLVAVPAAGGKATPLTQLGAADVAHVEPRFLPDGKTLLFSIRPRSSREGQLAELTLDTKRVERIGAEGSNPIGMLDGKLLYGREDGTVNAVGFDQKQRHTFGAPIVVLDGVRTTGGLAAAVSSRGSVLYVHGSDDNSAVLVDQRGATADSLPDVKPYGTPRISPDGRRAAFSIRSSGQSDVWIYNFADRVLSRFTDNGHSTRPEWTPDGRRIAYVTDPESEVWWQPADRSAPAQKLYASEQSPPREIAFAPDGGSAVLRTSSAGSQRDLALLQLTDPAHPVTPLVHTEFNELMPRVSPDGKWLAYQSDETGEYEVYVRAFPGPGARVQVSSAGGVEPVWVAPDRLLYRAFDKMMAASLATGETPAVTARETLFADPYRRAPLSRPEYDAAPGGGRLLMIRPSVDDNDVVMIVNWLGELRRRTAR
jgi:serine/threonine-protein kinase